MSPAIYPSFFFTVVLLVTTAYFLLGGLPLLVLQHDTALDARFIRSFFNIYYKGTLWAALGAALSFALWGRPVFAIGAAAMALIALALRKRLIPVMEAIGAQIEAAEESAIRRFRKVHSAALLINLTQLVVIVWGIINISV